MTQQKDLVVDIVRDYLNGVLTIGQVTDELVGMKKIVDEQKIFAQTYLEMELE